MPVRHFAYRFAEEAEGAWWARLEPAIHTGSLTISTKNHKRIKYAAFYTEYKKPGDGELVGFVALGNPAATPEHSFLTGIASSVVFYLDAGPEIESIEFSALGG